MCEDMQKAKIKPAKGLIPHEVSTCHLMPKYLMERFGLLRYAAQKGITRYLIEYDADKEVGQMDVITAIPDERLICEIPAPEDRKDRKAR